MLRPRCYPGGGVRHSRQPDCAGFAGTGTFCSIGF